MSIDTPKSSQQLSPLADALKPVIEEAIPLSLTLQPDAASQAADVYIDKFLNQTLTPDDRKKQPAGTYDRTLELRDFSADIDDAIRRTVLKSPVVEENPARLMEAAGEGINVRVVDSAIPGSYYDVGAKAVVLTKAFADERTTDELRAQVMTMADAVRNAPDAGLADSNGHFDPANVIYGRDRDVADTLGGKAVHTNILKLREDRNTVNRAMEAKLGPVAEHAREAGERLAEYDTSTPDESQRIVTLDYYLAPDAKNAEARTSRTPR